MTHVSMNRLKPLLLGYLLLLSGCGFTLRDENLDLAAIDISATESYGPLIAEVQNQFKLRGVDVNPAGGASHQLHLISERSSRRPVTSTSQINAAEYELRLELMFTLLDAQQRELIAPASLVLERVYSVDRNNVFGSSQEEVLITDEMRVALAQQLIRRVGLYLQANPPAPVG